MPNGAELFVESIVRWGVDTIFTLVGDHLNEVLAAAARRGVRIVDMRHESGVTHAADAWGRIHRRPAVSLVTGGPGHTNSITGIATAQLACSPLIAVSGSRASTMAERQAFQDIDQVGTVRGITKWSGEPPGAGQIPFYLARAWAEANAGRRGAVHLTIPVNLFAASVVETPIPDAPQSYAAPPDARDMERAVAMLRAAERPVVIAGSGIWWSGAEAELRAFVERTSMPLYTITMARGVVPDNHPLSMGYADPALNGAVHHSFREADLVLVLGKRIDYRLSLGGARLFAPQTKFIQVDIHPQELGMNRRLDLAICADVKATLSALTDAAGAEQWSALAWLDRLRTLRAEWEGRLASASSDRSSPMHPAAFYRELSRALPANVLYSWDGGDFAHWGRALLPAMLPGGWLRLGPLGTIGSALPNAIALQLAHPREPVVAITGDGSLGFYIAELDTLVRHGLPVVIIVGNDAGWGLERELQSLVMDSGSVACELRATQYDVVMQGFGGSGETVESLEEVGPAVRRALASGVPYLVNVKIRGVRSPFTDWQIAGKTAKS
jgi:acetolactate synthase-1/2/3 large subunit